MRHAFLLAVLLASSGCGQRVTDAPERSATFQGSEIEAPASEIDDATAQAERLCAAYGRKARIESIEADRVNIRCVEWHPPPQPNR